MYARVGIEKLGCRDEGGSGEEGLGLEVSSIGTAWIKILEVCHRPQALKPQNPN